MKDLYHVLHQKEMDLARVRKEIETLHSIIPLLAEDRDRPGNVTEAVSPAPGHGRWPLEPESRGAMMEIKRISPEQAKELLDSNKGFIYLDVRTVSEFEAGHVPGAKNVPVVEPAYGRMQINPRFVKIVETNFGKEVKCITGCQSGGRSLKAAELLVAAGFVNVVDMRGGFGGELDQLGRLVYPGWAPRGLPVSRERAPEDRYENLGKTNESAETA